jgi:hypothetical protein
MARWAHWSPSELLDMDLGDFGGWFEVAQAMAEEERVELNA